MTERASLTENRVEEYDLREKNDKIGENIMKITVVCEYNASMSSPEGVAAYPEGLGECLKEMFSSFGYETVLHTYDDKRELVLSEEELKATDVLVWWGHWYHGCIADEIAARVADQVNKGMGFIVLHSAHHSKPFKRLMGTNCNLIWRENNENERMWAVDPYHPIVKGLTPYIDIDHEETYGESFDVPTPDELVLISWFRGGEVMRSGCVWKRGMGKVFYLRCGHETNPTYHNEKVRTLLHNAAEYVKPQNRIEAYVPDHRPTPPEGEFEIKK